MLNSSSNNVATADVLESLCNGFEILCNGFEMTRNEYFKHWQGVDGNKWLNYVHKGALLWKKRTFQSTKMNFAKFAQLASVTWCVDYIHIPISPLGAMCASQSKRKTGIYHECSRGLRCHQKFTAPLLTWTEVKILALGIRPNSCIRITTCLSLSLDLWRTL